MQAATLALSHGEAHLWYTLEDEIRDPNLLAFYRGLLTENDWLRYRRLRFEHDQRQYLVTRALVRWTLSRYTSVVPEAFVFKANSWGKPEIESPQYVPLRFNASNTRGMVACLVALAHDVGVDVEDTTRGGETLDVAERFFSRKEVAALQTLPVQLRRERFFDYWTLKEAYIKGRGMGLSMPLEKFSIEFDGTSEPSVVLDRDVDDGEAWQLRLFRPTARHRLAAAVRYNEADRLTVSLRSVIPFEY